MTDPGLSSDDLAAIRTELAFQRNRLALDRTLMAVMRTSLALISFGFTLFSVFKSLAESSGLGSAFRDETPGRFGLALVIIGVLLLVAGLWSDMRVMSRLRARHRQLLGAPALAGVEPIPRSFVVVSAILLVLVGLVAFLVIVLRL